MSALFHTLFYDPLYNGLVFLIGIIPGGDAGLAIIGLTIIVKFILFPLSLKASRTQILMRSLEGKIAQIKEKYKDRQEQAVKTMELYRQEKVNPFSSFFLILIQLPVIFALYFVFIDGGLPSIHTDLLYFFVSVPSTVNTLFLGLVDLGEHNLILAILAGVTQYIQATISFSSGPYVKGAEKTFAHMMQLQMKYFFPLLIGYIAYRFYAAVALYWVASNIFAIGQELYVRWRMRHVIAKTQKTP